MLHGEGGGEGVIDGRRNEGGDSKGERGRVGKKEVKSEA